MPELGGLWVILGVLVLSYVIARKAASTGPTRPRRSSSARLLVLKCGSLALSINTRYFQVMGALSSNVFGFLDDSIFLEEKYLDASFAQVPEAELRRHLDVYRAARASLEPPTPSNEGEIAVFTEGGANEHLLNQCAFYVDKVYTLDPLFSASTPPSEVDVALGVPPTIPRKWIAWSIQYLKNNRPLVEAGYLNFGIRHVPRNLPVLHSADNFFDALPRDVLDKIRSLAKVRTMLVTPDGRRLGTVNPIKTHTLSVSFKDHLAGYGFDYSNEVDPANAEAWAHYSDNAVNRAALMFASHMDESYRQAASFNASLLTADPFAAEVFGSPTPSSMTDLALPPLLGFDLPLMPGVSAETLMKIRNEDGEAFHCTVRLLQSPSPVLAGPAHPAGYAKNYHTRNIHCEARLAFESTAGVSRALPSTARLRDMQCKLGGLTAQKTYLTAVLRKPLLGFDSTIATALD